ncbi:MAG: hypothetical protein FJ147_07720 [Deltaproteobacteria bacterium]|nr:hypothetical protein [Deltaproteobacteria bacterium]
MGVQNYEELIIYGIKGLPDETLAEIVDFVYFARQRALHPQVFAEERQLGLLGQDLKQLSRDEETHLEQEFADYEQRYPRE